MGASREQVPAGSCTNLRHTNVMQYILSAAVLILAFFSTRGYAYSSGAPNAACTTLRPGTPHGSATQTGNGGYVISLPSSLPRRSSGAGFNYQAGVSYTIRIEKTDSSVPDFIGFVLQAVSPDTTDLLGTFSTPGGNRRYMSCTGNGMASVTHSINVARSSEEFTWNSPTTQDGAVDFRYTVVRTMPVFYFALVASEVNFVVRQPPTTQMPSPPSTDPTTDASPTNSPTTTQEITDPPVNPTSQPPGSPTSQPPGSPTTEPPGNPTIQPPGSPSTGVAVTTVEANDEMETVNQTDDNSMTTLDGGMVLSTLAPPTTESNVKFASESKTARQVEAILEERSGSKGGEVMLREPSDCERAQCKTYVSIRMWPGTPGVLDIYLEGGAASWVAVGFTPTPSMMSADVVACVRYPPTEGILVLDSWNIPDQNFNEPDESQEDVAINFGQYEDGRISCRVNRTVASSSSAMDFNLDGDYYILYGVSNRMYIPSLTSPNLTPHEYGPNNNPRVTAGKQNVVKLTSAEVLVNSESTTEEGAERVFAQYSLILSCFLLYLSIA